MSLPNDPIMLYSFINTKLRDEYSSLDELTKSLGVDKDAIITKLKGCGYTYDEKNNKFVVA